MSIVMEVNGNNIESSLFEISEKTDISKNMYDPESKTMRIVIHSDNTGIYKLFALPQITEKYNVGNSKNNINITFRQNSNQTLILYNPSITFKHIEKSMYMYEIESSVWKYDFPVFQFEDDLLVQKLHENAKVPTRAYATDAGLDLYSIEDVEIEPFTSMVIHTGIAIELPVNTYGQYGNRSSMSKRNLIILGGVIDQGYRGELIVTLYNLDQHVQHVYKGDRIAQLIVIPILYPLIKEVENINNSPRNNKGFGSSGR